MPQYTDAWVASMLSDPKPFPKDWRKKLALKDTRGGREASIWLDSLHGYSFKVTLRQNKFNRLNFGVFLFLFRPSSRSLIHLLRYDGKYHDHLNSIEQERIINEFHIHQFTERYFEKYGFEKMDGWAYTTNRYQDLNGAFRCLIEDASLELPEESIPLIEWL